MYKGHFITFEGGEGAGKTSVLDRLESTLKEDGYTVMRTREPGGIPISEKIRTIILDVNHTEMDSRTEVLLYAAARRQHLVEKIIPALAEGTIVLCDRFVDSSLVYQGYARGLGFSEVNKINEFAIDGYMPNLTLFFDVDPEIGLNRIQKDNKREWNRLDQEKIEFHERVRGGYHILLDSEQDRIKKIDANLPMESVYEQVIEKVQLYLSTIS